MVKDKNEVKEIDLLELFRIIGQGIKNIFLGVIKAILFLIVFGLRKAHYLAAIIIIGAFIGLALHSFSKPYYSSGMIIQPNGIPSTELIDYLNDLTAICKSNNTEMLATILNIPDSSARKIKLIKAFPYLDVNLDGTGDYIDFNGDYDPKDSTQQKVSNRLYLSVSLYENQSKEYLQRGIVNFISKNDYMIQLNNIRKIELREQITQTEIEIQKLDSLQDQEYFNKDRSNPVPTQSGGYIIYAEKDKPLYYQNKLSLMQNKQYLQKEYELIQGPITIIKDLSEFSVEDNPKGSLMVKFGFWFGVVGYIVLLIIDSRTKIQSFIKQ